MKLVVKRCVQMNQNGTRYLTYNPKDVKTILILIFWVKRISCHVLVHLNTTFNHEFHRELLITQAFFWTRFCYNLKLSCVFPCVNLKHSLKSKESNNCRGFSFSMNPLFAGRMELYSPIYTGFFQPWPFMSSVEIFRISQQGFNAGDSF